MVLWLLIYIQEDEEEEKQHGQNVKTNFSSNLKRKWYFSEIVHTQFCFDMFYAVKSSKVELKVRTEFINVWHGENTNTLPIPIIYTVLPCCKDPLLIGDKTHAQIALTPIRDKIICQTFRSILRPSSVAMYNERTDVVRHLVTLLLANCL